MNAKKVKRLRKLFREQHGDISVEPVYNMGRIVVEPNSWRQFKKQYTHATTEKPK